VRRSSLRGKVRCECLHAAASGFFSFAATAFCTVMGPSLWEASLHIAPGPPVSLSALLFCVSA